MTLPNTRLNKTRFSSSSRSNLDGSRKFKHKNNNLERYFSTPRTLKMS